MFDKEAFTNSKDENEIAVLVNPSAAMIDPNNGGSSYMQQQEEIEGARSCRCPGQSRPTKAQYDLEENLPKGQQSNPASTDFLYGPLFRPAFHRCILGK